MFLKKPEYDQNMTTLLVTENTLKVQCYKTMTETVIGKNVLADFFFSLIQLISLSGLHQKPFGFTLGEFFYRPSLYNQVNNQSLVSSSIGSLSQPICWFEGILL